MGNTKKNKKFETLCKMDQNTLKTYLESVLSDSGREVINEDGFLYSSGEIPILLCAHMDTVHKELPTEIIYLDGKISSPQGIGGDDRCGIYMILKILKKCNCHVAFFEDEEIGGKGSDKFSRSKTCKNLIGAFKYVIELDRKGKTDAVFYNCDNADFEDFITEKYWKTAYGSFTDICHICPELECAGVNLSCGYYEQHTKNEYVVISEMENNISEVIKLIQRSENAETFEYVEAAYTYNYGYGRGGYGSYYSQRKNNIVYYVTYIKNGIEECYETIASSEYEAIGMWCMDNPDMTYNCIVEIMTEDDIWR